MIRLLAVVGLAATLAACAPAPTPSPAQPTSTPTATTSTTQPTTSTTQPTISTTPATMSVTIYFGNVVLDPGASDCARVFAVQRTVGASGDVLTATMKELVAGPTAAEAAKGYTSWFSPATATSLLGATVSGNTSYVNLADIRTVIPNASTSCGSAALLAQLRTTAQQAAMTPRVLYAIKGQPATFWEWLQMGCDASNDNCDPAPFAG